MKLKDCNCGGIPEINCNIKDNTEFVVVCAACGNQTPACESLVEATSVWNEVYCCTLSAYGIESV